jgi:hypothetical protein
MTLPYYKSTETLYTIASRDAEAKAKFTRWTQSSRSIQARVEEHRLHIYDQNTLSLFYLTWNHTWDNLLIWDTYLKRHLYF